MLSLYLRRILRPIPQLERQTNSGNLIGTMLALGNDFAFSLGMWKIFLTRSTMTDFTTKNSYLYLNENGLLHAIGANKVP